MTSTWWGVACAVVVAACRPMMPPPTVALHTDTAAEPKGETTAMIILGLTTQVFDQGIGVALRVEHQETTRTTVGAELTAGKDADYWLVAARGYGRTSPRDATWTAATYGVGLTYINVGLVALTANAGAAVSYVNDKFEPYLQTGLALSIPLRQPSRKWGDPPLYCAECEPAVTRHDFVPIPHMHTVLYGFLDPGFVVPLGDTGTTLSMEAAAALAIHPQRSNGLLSLSIAASHR